LGILIGFFEFLVSFFLNFKNGVFVFLVLLSDFFFWMTEGDEISRGVWEFSIGKDLEMWGGTQAMQLKKK
jgi:hypothetical protein